MCVKLRKIAELDVYNAKLKPTQAAKPSYDKLRSYTVIVKLEPTLYRPTNKPTLNRPTY